MLYELDMSSGALNKVILNFWTDSEMDDETRVFANDLVKGVVAEKEKIDSVLSEHSTNWKISRMAAVDKNILRMATYELMHMTDIPVKVTINEAVEIAKRFGTAESGAFVNGILDNIARVVAKDFAAGGTGA